MVQNKSTERVQSTGTGTGTEDGKYFKIKYGYGTYFGS